MKFRLTVRPNTPTINLKELLPRYTPAMKNSIEPTIIVQVGVGGTGSYIVPEIFRYIGSLPEDIRNKVCYTIIDGDIVEAKNLDRQNFIADDLGKNKAEALIDAYAEYYQVNQSNVKAIPKYITSPNDLYEALKYECITTHNLGMFLAGEYAERHYTLKAFDNVLPHVIIIDAVDKTTPRKFIMDFMETHRADNRTNTISDIYVVSCGNGKFSGQVSIGRYVYDGGRNRTYFDVGVTANDILKKELNNGMKVLFSLEHVSKWKDVTLPIMKTTANILIGDNVNAEFPIFRSVSPSYYNTHRSFLATATGYEHTITDFTLDENNNFIRSVEAEINRCYITPERYLSCLVNTKLPYDRFPDLVDLSIDEKEEQLSCADRAVQNVQSIQANKTASNIACNYIMEILGCMYPMTKDKKKGISVHTVMFDSETNSFTSETFDTSEFVD